MATLIPYPAVLDFHLLAVLVFLSGLIAATLLLAAAGPPAGAAEWRRLRGLNLFVTTPALALVWAAGLTLAHEGGWFADGWLHAKIGCVVLLTLLHAWQSRLLAVRAGGTGGGRLPRWALAAPPVLASAIVWLVVEKPG